MQDRIICCLMFPKTTIFNYLYAVVFLKRDNCLQNYSHKKTKKTYPKTF